MDETPTRAMWIQFLNAVPDNCEIMRFDYGDTDGFFQIELWVPRKLSEMVELLSKFPDGSTVESITNESDGDLAFSLSIPKVMK